MKSLSLLSIAFSCLCIACAPSQNREGRSEATDLVALSSGVYKAYAPAVGQLTSAPAGYEAFYISNYNRHGSRYQPNDKRYANTLRRLTEGHEKGVLTPYGESLLPQIQVLCDSCLGHGGLLTSVGVRQLAGIGKRMADRFPEVFTQAQPNSDRPKHISARASVVPRCGQSMNAFFAGLFQSMNQPFYQRFPGQRFNVLAEVDSAYMSYIAYDTPAMRQLSSKDAPWQSAFQQFYKQNTLLTSVIDRVYTDATGLDSLQFVDDLYWLTIGMQNVDVVGCDLSQAFTPEELFSCYHCVNYRMYVCNANAPLSNHIPAQSASTLLMNIVSSADEAIATDTVAATLRFGHDSNLLRLMALMRMQGATAEVDDPAEAWRHWQEAKICPMGANIQLIYYRNNEGNVLVKFLHNEAETLLDVEGLKPIEGPYYSWNEVRTFFLSKIKLVDKQPKTDFVEPVQ